MNGKKKRKSKDELKNELVRSLVEVDVYENEEWAKRPDNVTNYEDSHSGGKKNMKQSSGRQKRTF